MPKNRSWFSKCWTESIAKRSDAKSIYECTANSFFMPQSTLSSQSHKLLSPKALPTTYTLFTRIRRQVYVIEERRETEEQTFPIPRSSLRCHPKPSFIPILSPIANPCGFDGRFDSPKKATPVPQRVWRTNLSMPVGAHIATSVVDIRDGCY